MCYSAVDATVLCCSISKKGHTLINRVYQQFAFRAIIIISQPQSVHEKVATPRISGLILTGLVWQLLVGNKHSFFFRRTHTEIAKYVLTGRVNGMNISGYLRWLWIEYGADTLRVLLELCPKVEFVLVDCKLTHKDAVLGTKFPGRGWKGDNDVFAYNIFG